MTKEQPTIELPYATILYEPPIVHIVFKTDIELGFPETRELIASAEKISHKRPYVIFADARVKVQVTREGRKVAANEKEAPYHKGSAILVENNMLALGLNFFSGLITPSYPYRAFTDRESAMEWLKKISENLK